MNAVHGKFPVETVNENTAKNIDAWILSESFTYKAAHVYRFMYYKIKLVFIYNVNVLTKFIHMYIQNTQLNDFNHISVPLLQKVVFNLYKRIDSCSKHAQFLGKIRWKLRKKLFPLFGLLWMWKGKYDLRHGVQKCCACYSIQQTPRTGLFQHKRQKWKLTEEMWYQSQLNTNNNIHTRTLQYVNENHFIW